MELGREIRGGALDSAARVGVPPAMMNRHGLVAGATGTGETRSPQVMAEQLAAQGVLVADVAGDNPKEHDLEELLPALGIGVAEILAGRLGQVTVPGRTERVPLPRRAPEPTGDPLGDVLSSPEALELSREVMRGVFGTLREPL